MQVKNLISIQVFKNKPRLSALMLLLAILLQAVSFPLSTVPARASQEPLSVFDALQPLAAGASSQDMSQAAPGGQQFEQRASEAEALEAALYDLPAALTGKQQVKALRSEYSATFNLGDGSYVTLQDNQPLHYLDSQDEWQPIDLAYDATPNGWMNTKNSLTSVVGQRSSQAQLGNGQVGVSWTPQGVQAVDAQGQRHTLATPLKAATAAPGIRSSDSTIVRYVDSWSLAGLEDQWRNRRGGAEYSMRLSTLPEAGPFDPTALELSILLQLAPNTQILQDGRPLRLPAAGEKPLEIAADLTFAGSFGQQLALQPPRAFEEGDTNTATPGRYSLRAGPAAEQVELLLSIPWKWLADTGRTFPVIIDPLFQMRSSTQIGFAYYEQNGEHIATDEDAGWTAIGNLPGDDNWIYRGVLRFQMPHLPSGSALTQAYLVATPNGINRDNNVLAMNIEAFAATNDWYTTGGEPLFDAGAPLPLVLDEGDEYMTFSNGEKYHDRMVWDLSSLVPNWMPGLGDENHGLVLRNQDESCDPDLFAPIVPGMGNPFCGIFYFDHPSTWSDFDLDYTQYRATPENLYLLDSENTGFRLMVFFTGPTLTEDSVFTMAEPGGGNMPVSSQDPYWEADHVFTVPEIPNDRWQAVVSRALAEPVGPITPTETGLENAYRLFVTDTLPMQLNSRDFVTLRDIGAPIGTPGTILFNGRGQTGGYIDEDLVLRVEAPAGAGTYTPASYDVRLIGEQGTISTTLNSYSNLSFEMDSADPLALWNLQMPVNSNTKVWLDVTNDGTEYDTYLSEYEDDFDGYIVRSQDRGDLPTLLGNDGTQTKSTQLDPDRPSAIQSFTVQSGQYALAMRYRGPKLIVYDYADGCPEICPPPEVIPIRYTISIKVLSCPAGAFPTKNGGCQQVSCPDNTWDYSASTAGLGLWSAAGWNVSGATGNSIPSTQAPLIGPATPGDLNSPTVAVVGGIISYDNSNNTVTTTDDSSFYLIQCPNPQTDNFNVYDGAMNRVLVNFVTPALARTAPDQGQLFTDPWLSEDEVDFIPGSYIFRLRPLTGMATGEADINRYLGSQDPLTRLRFSLVWSWNVTGWSSLTAATAEYGVNPAPPSIASLQLDLGDSYSVDISPDQGKDIERSFTMLRATQAAISQQASMGGASRPVQAVILPRSWQVKEINLLCPASCLDLRNPGDQPNQSPANRTWDMPDIHTNVDAQMVMYRQPGELIAFSADHPANQPGSPSDFSQEFSFDAYQASVSVTREACLPGEPEGMVIRGGASMALPNIGGDGSGGKIAANFKLCETSDPPGSPAEPKLRQVHMEFSSPVGVPIGNSGLFLTGLSGEVNINPGFTEIRLGLQFQAAPGGDGGIFRVWGEVVIDTRGMFAFNGNAKVLGIVDATGSLWVAWNPMDIGFQVGLSVEDWLSGNARAHMWEGRGWLGRYSWLPDNDEMHFAGAISAYLTIPEGLIVDWEILTLPPDDIVFGIEVAFGQFCTNSSCTRYEWGVKGNFVILGYDIGLYYGFDEGLDFIMGNDDHILIDDFGGGSGLAAMSDMATLPGLAATAGLNLRQAPAVVNGSASITFTVSIQAEQILLGAGWQAGAPTLNLIDPNGVEITPDNAAAHQAQFALKPASTLVSVNDPLPGAWQARLDNLSENGIEHYKFFYVANKGAPGEPGDRGDFTHPNQADEPGTGMYTITWDAPTDTPDTAVISLYYYHTQVITGNLEAGVPIVQNLPYNTGQYEWDTTGLRNGSYQIRAVVDDGINDLPSGEISLPNDACVPLENGWPAARAFDPLRFPGTVVFTSTGTVAVNDITAPEPPTDLTAVGVDNAILVRWSASPSPDVSAYILRWGHKLGDAFSLENQKLIATGNAGEQLTAQLVAVNNGEWYGLNIQSVDVNGNQSMLSNAAFASPSATNNPVPEPPVNLTAGNLTSSSVDLTWEAAPGSSPHSYRVQYMRLDASGQISYTAPVTATALTLNNLETGASYQIGIQAGNRGSLVDYDHDWYSPISQTLNIIVSSSVDGDGDGLPDDWAQAHGVSGASDDSDGDGLDNAGELQAGTNPSLQDSDGDGFSDAEELLHGTNPLDSLEYGAMYEQPRLALEKERLSFSLKLQDGGAPAPQSVLWSNIGGGVLSLQASSASSWVVPSIVSNTIQVAVDGSQLTPGFYSGIVELTAAPGSDPIIGGPSCLRVNAWVMPPDVLVGPKINGSMIATGIVGQPFSYNIEISGTQPLQLTAAPLPAGLSLNGAVISGTPTQVGQTSVQLTLSNYAGTDTRTLTITILPAESPTLLRYLPLMLK